MSDIPSSRPKGQDDPGWNDPPKLQFNSVQAGTNKPRLNLNKRVAFPLQGSASVTSKPTAIVHPSHSPMSTPPVAIVPPMARAVPAPDVAPSSALTESRLGTTDDSGLTDSERQMCIDTFNSFVPCVKTGINIRPDEVQRRINLMNQMWLSGTLAPTVQRKIHRIANALNDMNFPEAIESHRALVVDHSNICVAWGSALRQIILTIQSDNGETTSTEQELPVIPDSIAVHSALTSGLERQTDRSNADNASSDVQQI